MFNLHLKECLDSVTKILSGLFSLVTHFYNDTCVLCKNVCFFGKKTEFWQRLIFLNSQINQMQCTKIIGISQMNIITL